MDQLIAQRIEHVVNGKLAVLFSHLRIKEDLQQQITEFVGEFRPVAIINRFQNLVGLFQRVFFYGVKRLLTVPGTSTGSPQARHDGNGFFKFFARGHDFKCITLSVVH